MADKHDYILQTNYTLVENIKLADQKAALFIAIDSAIIGSLYSAKLLILDPSSWKQGSLTIASIATFLPLIVGTFLAIWVITPRGEVIGRGSRDGRLVIPSRIAHDFPDEPTYAAEALGADEKKYASEFVAMIYWRGRINDIKYTYLKRAIKWSLGGWVAAILFLCINTVLSTNPPASASATKLTIRENGATPNAQVASDGDAEEVKVLERRLHAVNP